MRSKIEVYSISIPVRGLIGDTLKINYVGTYDEMLLIRRALIKGSRVEVTVNRPVLVE